MEPQRLHSYRRSSERAVKALLHQLAADGSYGPQVHDLASYYKSPYLFALAGRPEAAYRILTYIKHTFLQANGDFVTSAGLKSENAAFVEYWAYINGWITLAAQKIGRFDVAYPAYHYLHAFYHPRHGGFTTHHPYRQTDNVVDVLSTAHLGLTSLYFGDLERATRAGQLLHRFVALQPTLQQGFYLRMNEAGEVITTFPQAAQIFFLVSAGEPNQAYFMIGYPIAFLAKLYQATRDAHYLATATSYLAFALSCRGNLPTSSLSHKVAWGAAIMANLTNEVQYAHLAQSIADYLVRIQDPSGMWLPDQPAHTSFDQTAEIAIWLREISAELSRGYASTAQDL